MNALFRRSGQTYNSIDELPIWNWWRIHETGDLCYLYTSTSGNPEKVIDLWNALYNDYLKRYGLNESFLNYLDKKKRIALMKVDCIVNNKPHLQTFIEIEEKELKDDYKHEQSDNNKVVVLLEKHLGFSLDVKTLPVAKYYTYLNDFNG